MKWLSSILIHHTQFEIEFCISDMRSNNLDQLHKICENEDTFAMCCRAAASNHKEGDQTKKKSWQHKRGPSYGMDGTDHRHFHFIYGKRRIRCVSWAIWCVSTNHKKSARSNAASCEIEKSVSLFILFLEHLKVLTICMNLQYDREGEWW